MPIILDLKSDKNNNFDEFGSYDWIIFRNQLEYRNTKNNNQFKIVRNNLKQIFL